jgi:deoxyribodipyrimidine photo-lyase
MGTSVLLFNRDLRVHDHPALDAASRAERFVPLFVLDEAILGSRFAVPNRLAFMLESLRDLDASLKQRGARLFVRRGDAVEEAMRVAKQCRAEAIHVSADYSAFARGRERRLARACGRERMRFEAHPGVTVVAPGELTPSGGDHFRVFSPYWRRWSSAGLRSAARTPQRLRAPARLRAGHIPSLAGLLNGKRPSPDLLEGGERAGRVRMRAFLHEDVGAYERRHDDLPGDATSRLSPYLRFGCVSPLELLAGARQQRGGGAYARQLCWRDFHHQVLAAFPSLPRRDYRHRGDRWSRSRQSLQAWREGRTGFPIVDAGMRQLAREGYMHNRARLITASFLTKDLYVDWRRGAGHFWDLLIDGEIANNAGNWQWVAGTGNDTRPNRVFNPLRQAQRFDPDGDYVRRYVEELAGVEGPAVHRPWRLPRDRLRGLDYPEPIVDHAEAAAEFAARRSAG